MGNTQWADSFTCDISPDSIANFSSAIGVNFFNVGASNYAVVLNKHIGISESAGC